MVVISIATYNVRGLRGVQKRRKVFNYLHDHDFSLVVLQETHASPDIEKFWSAEWGRKIFFANGTTASRGVAVLLNRKLDAQIGEVIRDIEGRYLIMQVAVDDIQFVIVSIYAPNVDDPQFFANVFSMAETVAGRKIFAGDFNTVLDLDKDIKGGKGFTHVNATRFIKDYLAENDYVDIWREKNPNTFRATFIIKTIYDS